jgi:hypothetical protein
MVAFARTGAGSVALEGDFAQTILRQRGLTLGELHVWLEPKQPTDDERRAAIAARIPPMEDLMLISGEVPREWLEEKSWSR